MKILPQEEATFSKLLELTSNATSIPRNRILSKERTHRVVAAKRIIAVILKEYMGWSLSKIGHCLNGQNHATIINHGVRHIADYDVNYMGYRVNFDKVINTFVKDGGLRTQGVKKNLLDRINAMQEEWEEIKKIILDA